MQCSPGKQYTIEMRCKATFVGLVTSWLLFSFETSKGAVPFKIGRTIKISVRDPLRSSLPPDILEVTSPYKRKRNRKLPPDEKMVMVDGEKPPSFAKVSAKLARVSIPVRL
jgi:hypothetical protein